MSGRPLCSEKVAISRGFVGLDCARRRQVLRETIDAFQLAGSYDHYLSLAKQNLDRWQVNKRKLPSALRVEVFADDWGEVTSSVTSEYGECFAVLNMANALVPGGAYVEGAAAQEENMFRRTDCHFRIDDDEYDRAVDRYYRHMTRLLSAQNGYGYLDVRHPRVCIRGPEDRSREDLGYLWLLEDQVFPFYELRAAAQDLRGSVAFNPREARRRISAQLDTLRSHGKRFAVLGAFGCGAFRNPADHIAQIY